MEPSASMCGWPTRRVPTPRSATPRSESPVRAIRRANAAPRAMSCINMGLVQPRKVDVLGSRHGLLERNHVSIAVARQRGLGPEIQARLVLGGRNGSDDQPATAELARP